MQLIIRDLIYRSPLYKVDVDQEPELAGAFGIQSIPTFALCPMEGEPHFMMGAMDKSAFKEAIEKYLLK